MFSVYGAVYVVRFDMFEFFQRRDGKAFWRVVDGAGRTEAKPLLRPPITITNNNEMS